MKAKSFCSALIAVTIGVLGVCCHSINQSSEKVSGSFDYDSLTSEWCKVLNTHSKSAIRELAIRESTISYLEMGFDGLCGDCYDSLEMEIDYFYGEVILQD